MRNTKISGRKVICTAALGLTMAFAGAMPALAAEATAADPAEEAIELVEAAEEEGFIGHWELVSVVAPEEETEGMSGEDMAAMMAMMGMTISLDVNDDGTFALSMAMGDEAEGGEGTWEQLDDISATFEVEGEQTGADLNDDGTLTLWIDEENAYVFGRDGAGAIAGALTTIDDPEGFYYTWKLVAMDLPGEEDDLDEDMFALLGAFGMQGFLTIDEDGTFALEISMGDDGESAEGTFEAVSETEGILSGEVDGEEDSLPAVIQDGRLLLTEGEGDEAMTLIFAAIDPEAWAAYLAGDEAEADGDEAAAEGAYADGTYEASGKGIGGDVPVTVTIEGGVIAAVEVGDNGETQGIGSKAIEQLPALIVEANGLEGVDGVSGASVTSKAIFSAVEDALAQAAV